MLIVYLQDRCRLRASLAFSGESNLHSLNLAQKFLCDRVEPQRGDSWVLWLLVPARPALLDDVLGTIVRRILYAGSDAGGEDRQAACSRHRGLHSTGL